MVGVGLAAAGLIFAGSGMAMAQTIPLERPAAVSDDDPPQTPGTGSSDLIPSISEIPDDSIPSEPPVEGAIAIGNLSTGSSSISGGGSVPSDPDC